MPGTRGSKRSEAHVSDIGDKILGIVGAIIGLAVLAIVISNQANTTNVLTSFFAGLSNLIGVAISPVTGQSVSGLTAGLQGGAWSGGTSGFSLSGGSYGVNVGGVGQIANAAGGFAGGLLRGAAGGAYGYAGSIAAGSSGTNLAGSLGGSGGSGALAQDFIDSGTF